MSVSVRAGTYHSQSLSGVQAHGVCDISNIEKGGVWTELNAPVSTSCKGGWLRVKQKLGAILSVIVTVLYVTLKIVESQEDENNER